jgi:hypothetical protein
MRPEKERLFAESLFVCEGKSCREIAGILGAGRDSVQRWAREGKWSERRRRRRLDGSSMTTVERLRRERDRLVQQLVPRSPPGGDRSGKVFTPKALQAVSAVQKLTQTIEKMEPHREEGIDFLLDVMKRYSEFVSARASQDERVVLHKWLEQFLDAEQRKYVGG